MVSLIVLFVFSVPQSRSYSPTWLKPGAYATYGTLPVVFEWDCLSVEGSIVKLNVSLFTNETIATPTGWVGENLYFSAEVNVDTETREVSLLNGSAFGKTLLWLPANPRDGEIINISGKTAKISVGGTTDTPQGAQNIFRVINWSIPFSGYYDLDTGVRISGFSGDEWVYEGTIKALGIKNRLIRLLGLSDTNIDLGPQEWWPVIGRYLIFAPLIAVFIIVPVFILRRRQKRARMNARLKSRRRTRREQDPDLDI